MAEEETLLDVDDLDSLTLDDVEAAPDFLTPPSGKYRLGVKDASIQKREVDGETKQSIRIIYQVRKTLELNNQEDDLVPDGSLFSENFNAPGEGLKFFKARMKKLLGDDLAGISIKDMLAFLPKQFGEDENGQRGDQEILTTLKRVTTKDKESGNEYENVRFQKIEVVPAGGEAS